MTPPIEGSDGRFYGTQTTWVNANQTIPRRTFVYRLDPATGTTLVLDDFPASNESGTWPDGTSIRGRLLEVPALAGHDIGWVDTTVLGGSDQAGTVFRIDVAGDVTTFTKLHDFVAATGTYRGESPAAGLIRDPSTGALYGTTIGYGVFGGPGVPGSGELGTIYRMTLDGTVVKLYGDAFIEPYAPLLLASDGRFYGSTFANSGAPNPSASPGSIFRLSRATQAALSVTGAPANAVYATSFVVGAAGGSGTGAVTFAATGACTTPPAARRS